MGSSGGDPERSESRSLHAEKQPEGVHSTQQGLIHGGRHAFEISDTPSTQTERTLLLAGRRAAPSLSGPSPRVHGPGT